MKEIIVGETKLFWNNPEEILGMGGPWIGDLMVGERITATCTVVNNFLFDKKHGKIYFIRYNRVSEWANDNFFSIQYYALNSCKVYNMNKAYDSIYLDSIDGNFLIAFKAFHNKDSSKRISINLTTGD
jgi:hypothetical protein